MHTKQRGPQEEGEANRYLFPPGGSAESTRWAAVICQYRFLSDFNPLWPLSSCPFAHTELPLSNCHGSLLPQYQTIFAWSRFSLRSCLFSTKAHTARQWLLLCKIKSCSFKPYQGWDVRHKKNKKGDRKAVILRGMWMPTANSIASHLIVERFLSITPRSLGYILIYEAAQHGCNDWIIIKIN